MTAFGRQENFAGNAGGEGQPLPPTIEQLGRIWSRVLGVAPVLPDANFFDLGGDSFLAMTMLLEIERETGINIPFTAIYDAPTIELLAAYLGKQAPKFSPLVCLKSGEGSPALFIVHGIGGTVMELAKLGTLVDYRGAIYAVQAKGLDGTESPLSKVEDMAAYYLAAIREVQPHGPYLLAGYSFGGLVALEMCRRLREMDEIIGLLVLIDSYAHPRTWPLHARIGVRWRRLMHRAGLMAQNPRREALAYAQLTIAQLQRKLQRRGERANSVMNWLGDHTRELTPTLRLVRAGGEMAVDAYVPRYYPGKLIFVRAERCLPVFPVDPRRIWKPLAESVTVHSVRGDHFTILGEHVASIAARLSACLNHARAGRNMCEVPRRDEPGDSPSRPMEGVPC